MEYYITRLSLDLCDSCNNGSVKRDTLPLIKCFGGLVELLFGSAVIRGASGRRKSKWRETEERQWGTGRT